MAATMQFKFREQWRDFRRGRPGRRFQSRYERARKSERTTGKFQRVLIVAFALVCFALGVVFAVIPGPALPFFFLGGGLLATESRPIARFMDWGEVEIRKVVAWGRRRWRRLPILARVVVVVLLVGCSAGSAYLSYRFFRG